MTTLVKNAHLVLNKPKHSIFVSEGFTCREFPSHDMLYGFIHNKMGIKLRKHVAKLYTDEQTHYKNYVKNTKTEDGIRYISTTYSLSNHGWGRINARDSLSLSLFHRPTRHTVSMKEYIDFDMVNCQIQILMELAKKSGINVDGLKKYCENPKKLRAEIVEYYNLKDIITEDGYVLKAMEQAKKLPLRLGFGGTIEEWRKEYVRNDIPDMPLILKIKREIEEVSIKIVECNPHIMADLEKYKKDFDKKTEAGKRRSLVGSFAQTFERLLQEECIAYLVRTYKRVSLRDIVPCQDGFMVLRKQLEDVHIPDLLHSFSTIIHNKFDLNMTWVVKDFDEAYHIPTSTIFPMVVTLNDLNNGERNIADLVYPALQPYLKFIEDGDGKKKWFYLNDKNIWITSSTPNEYLIVKTLQHYIKEEQNRIWSLWAEEKDEQKKKELKEQINAIQKHYTKVGGPSYSRQLAKYLQTLLLDNDFVKLLDNTKGKLIFKDGILDLKTKHHEPWFKPEDYITTTLSYNYLDLKKDETKYKYLLGELKKILNNNEEHLQYYLGIIGHAMTGEAHLEKAVYYIMDGTPLKKGDNGKTFMFGLLQHCFPDLITIADPKVLDNDYKNAHKNLAKMKGKRIVYADEGSKKFINAALFKKIGDGDTIENEVMFGTTEIIDIMFKFFVCSNHLPRFHDDENAVYNRLRQVMLCSHFDRSGKRTEPNPENLEFIADITLGDKLKKEYFDEIVWLVIDYANKYYHSRIPAIPEAFSSAVEKTKESNNRFAVWVFGNCDKDPEGRVSVDKLLSIASYSQNTYIRSLKREDIITNMECLKYKYESGMSFGYVKKWVEGVGEKNIQIKGGFSGLRLTDEDGTGGDVDTVTTVPA